MSLRFLLGLALVASAAPAGELVENVATKTDPAQTYTLYLPTGYGSEAAPDQRWPALLIFDPRGRGTPAAEIFQPGAERLGWILISSNHTASDGHMEPNLHAVNALLPELARRWAVDPARVYATGMSGTAVVAWLVAQQTGALAGVIAAAGPRSPGLFEGVEQIAFAHFGTVGTADFNFTEMRFMDDLFARLGAPHRLAVFDGPHGWMSPEIAARAMGWMEVQAMRHGRRPMDAELVKEVFTEELGSVRAEEESGNLHRALAGYRELANGFEGLGMVGEGLKAIQGKVAALSENPQVAQQDKELAAWDDEETRNRQRLAEVAGGLLASAQPGNRPWTAERIVEELRIETLLQQAQGEGVGAGAAKRMLATITAQLSFYLRRELWQRKAWREAGAVLEAATVIHPDRADLWYDLACARALEGRKKPALDALETAVEKGFTDVEHLQSDPDLEGIRKTEGYRVLVERLGIPSRSPS